MLCPFRAARLCVAGAALTLLTACGTPPAQPATPPVAGVTGVPSRATASPYPAPARTTPDRLDAVPYPAAPPSTWTVLPLPPTWTPTPPPAPTPTPPPTPTPLTLPASVVRQVDRLSLDRPWVTRADTSCTVRPHPDYPPLMGHMLGAVAPDGTIEEWPTPVITILRPREAPPILVTCAADQQLRLLTTATWDSSPPLTLPRPGFFQLYTVNAAGTEGIVISGMDAEDQGLYRVDLRSGVFTPIQNPFVLPFDYGIESILWITDTLHMVRDDGRGHPGYFQLDLATGGERPGSHIAGGNALTLSSQATWVVTAPLGGGSGLTNVMSRVHEEFGERYRMFSIAFTADDTWLAATGQAARNLPPVFAAIFDLSTPLSHTTPIPLAMPAGWGWDSAPAIETLPPEARNAGLLAWMPDQHLVLARHIHESFRTLLFTRTGNLARELQPIPGVAVRGKPMVGRDSSIYQLFQEGDRLVLRQTSSDGTMDHVGLPAGNLAYRLSVVP